ncbi:MAG: hypothetical protein ABI481_03185 [Pyrinomonadaceae bacterium]
MKTFKYSAAIGIGAFLFGCGSQANTNVTVSVNKAPSNAANAAATTVETAATVATVADEAHATGSLATPSDAYRTAYALREKKDLAGMKRVLSKDIIQFLEMMAESEKKTLDDEVAQMFEKPQAKTVEVRNEKIKGDRASVEYLDETGEWDIMDFVKEGKDWKLSLPDKDSPEAPPKKGK